MLDEQIDTVARQITEGAVPADLRVRILDRLDAQQAKQPRWIWMVSSAAVATAIFVVIALLWKPHDHRALQSQASAPRPAQTNGPGDGGVLAQVPLPLVANGAAVAPQPARERQPARRTRVAADFMMDPLPTPSSIELTALHLPALATADSMTTEPIVIAALELRPIDDPATHDQ